jgi:hypothetical protein
LQLAAAHGCRHVGLCGRICFNGREVNLSQIFAGQNVGVTQVAERMWLVTFMQDEVGYFGITPPAWRFETP